MAAARASHRPLPSSQITFIRKAGTPPPALLQGIGDAFTAMTAATGVLAALMERHQTGEGRFVEASLMRTGMWALGGELGQKALGGNPKPPKPRELSRTPMYNSYRTADDRWFFLVGVEARRHLPSVLRAIGREDLVDDERFKDGRSIGTHAAELIALFDQAFNSQPLAHWAAQLDKHEVWWAPIQVPEEVLVDAQAKAIGAWTEVEGNMSVDAPVRFDFQPRKAAPRAPQTGEHTEQVLADFGFSADEVQRLAVAANGGEK